MLKRNGWHAAASLLAGILFLCLLVFMPQKISVAGSMVQGYLTGNTSAVNIRSGTGTDTDAVGLVPAGSKVPYYTSQKANGHTWYYIEYNGIYGWVSGSCFDDPGTSSSATATPRPTPAPSPAAKEEIRGYVSSATAKVNLRAAASLDSASLGTTGKAGTVYPWYASVKVSKVTWYYIDTGSKEGWVSGDYFSTALPTELPAPEEMGSVYLTSTSCNLRSKASTDSEQLAEITEQDEAIPFFSRKESGSVTWYYVLYKKTYGWVCGRYFSETEPNATATPKATSVSTSKRLGYVKTTAQVNMRSGPGTKTDKITAIHSGEELPYYAIDTSNGPAWYYVLYDGKYGWVSVQYVEEISGTSATAKATAAPAATDKATATPKATSVSTSKRLGYVKTTAQVNMRSGPSTKTDKITSIHSGEELPYYAIDTSNGPAWYYVLYNGKYGWVSVQYVEEISGTSAKSAATATPKATAKATATPKATAKATATPKATAKATATPKATTVSTSKRLGYVKTTAQVNVRSGAGTKYSKVTTVPNGEKLGYYAVQDGWYYIKYDKSYGWVSGQNLDVLTGSAAATATPKPTVKATATPKATAKATATPKATTDPYLVSDGRTTMYIYPVELIDWYTGGIQSLFPRGSTYKVYDVKAKKIWSCYRQAGGAHADVEPATAADTAVLCSIYGVSSADQIASKNLWQRRPCLITIGKHTYACSLYGIPHGSNTISGNKMNGQMCLHFTNSKTHGTARVCPYHAAAITYAYNHAPNGKKK